MTANAPISLSKVDRWRVSDGEEACLTPRGPFAAEIRSRGFLPLRQRREGVAHIRAAFSGTAVALGDQTYEVIAEMEIEETVVYRLRVWPEGEVIRDRAVYSPGFVQAAEAERERARFRGRVRPFRFILYPLVGSLPEDAQERLCNRLGLYAVTATLVSGIAESVIALSALFLAGRATRSPESSIAFITLAPGLGLLVLPGLGRAFGAAALRETTGCWLVNLGMGIAEAFRVKGSLRDQTLVPITRQAFWARLAQGDRVTTEPDSSLIYSGTLPHLTWHPRRHIQAGQDYWVPTTLPPGFRHGRLVYRYRLDPVGDPPAPGSAPLTAPASLAYAEEVLANTQREWDDLLRAFAPLVSMLPETVQRRALERRGGPAAIKKATIVTAVMSILAALYALHFLPGPPGDPLAPLIALLGIMLFADGAFRLRRASRGEYAPSMFRFLLPCDSLRPERIHFHAHRDAEREALTNYSPVAE